MQVVDIDGDTLGFDVIGETLRATNLGELSEGRAVNFERSARVGDEIGGHNVSGHVCTTVRFMPNCVYQPGQAFSSDFRTCLLDKGGGGGG